MPDVLDPLERLRDATLTPPEPLESLRRRVSRRRRRQRAVLSVAGAFVVGALSFAVIDAVRPDDEQGLVMDDGPSTTETQPPRTNTPLIINEEISIDQLPGANIRVVATSHGIFVAPEEGAFFRRLTSHPASVAFGVGEQRIVAQYDAAEVRDQYGTTDVPIVVLDERGERVIEPPALIDAGGTWRLDDAGFVDGRPVAVVTASGGANPDQWDERLYLVDLDTLEKTDLGSVGHWEFGTFDARLAPDGVVVGTTRVSPAALQLELRLFDGSTAWSRSVDLWPHGDGGSQSLAIYQDQAEPPFVEVLLVETAADRSGTKPQVELLVRHFDLGTGADTTGEVEPVPIRAAPDLAELPSSCAAAQHAGMTALRCAQPLGPPYVVDFVTGEAYPITEAGNEGVMTIWRTG